MKYLGNELERSWWWFLIDESHLDYSEMIRKAYGSGAKLELTRAAFYNLTGADVFSVRTWPCTETTTPLETEAGSFCYGTASVAGCFCSGQGRKTYYSWRAWRSDTLLSLSCQARPSWAMWTYRRAILHFKLKKIQSACTEIENSPVFFKGIVLWNMGSTLIVSQVKRKERYFSHIHPLNIKLKLCLW